MSVMWGEKHVKTLIIQGVFYEKDDEGIDQRVDDIYWNWPLRCFC